MKMRDTENQPVCHGKATFGLSGQEISREDCELRGFHVRLSDRLSKILTSSLPEGNRFITELKVGL